MWTSTCSVDERVAVTANTFTLFEEVTRMQSDRDFLRNLVPDARGRNKQQIKSHVSGGPLFMACI